jgi:hypothetical protein
LGYGISEAPAGDPRYSSLVRGGEYSSRGIVVITEGPMVVPAVPVYS